MRLHLLLAKVEPKAIPVPSQCGYADCTSRQLRLHQPVKKALRDTVYHQVQAHRYRCLKCGRTFLVYPPGVTQAQSSEWVKGLAVMLYLLGFSYGAVSLALGSLGVPISKTEQPVEKLLEGVVKAIQVGGVEVIEYSAEFMTVTSLSSEISSPSSTSHRLPHLHCAI